MLRISFFIVLFGWSGACAAQTQMDSATLHSRWVVSAAFGYQWASAPQSLGRFADVLFGSSDAGVVSAFDLTCFWKPNWGGFVGGRLSHTPRNWPGALQQAIEHDYLGKLVRLNTGRGIWENSITQFLIGLRGRFVFKKFKLQPSFAAGFTESYISSGGADLKTPGSNALSNVFAFSFEGDPWVESFTLDTGGRLDIPLWKRFHLSFSANYSWVKPSVEFDFYTVDQISGAQSHERIQYKRSQHLFVLMGGLSYYFKRRWE